MNEEKSKLELIGEIAQANNKNLELIEELNNKENEIERLQEENDDLKEQVYYQNIWREEYLNRIDEVIEYMENHVIATETEEILLKILKGE